ncbi:MAG TPA: molybdate ABC transporter substrate-binding protein [Pseudomonadales bacterium]|jgi:molybdate transport system substrate-binding protein
MSSARKRSRLLQLLATCWLLAGAGNAWAERALAAVASNFVVPAELLAAEFERATGHTVSIAAGATGKLYAQVVQGAPFDLLLAADAWRPERLELEGRAVPGSRFTYAVGLLTLWSPRPDAFGEDPVGYLRAGRLRRLALANPDLAPYGTAARQVLEHLGLQAQLADKMVFAENIGQAHAMVDTGNADAGFLARAQVIGRPGSHWNVPVGMHLPIEQQAVLLRRAADNAAATGFLGFLRTEAARGAMATAGYGLP